MMMIQNLSIFVNNIKIITFDGYNKIKNLCLTIGRKAGKEE